MNKVKVLTVLGWLTVDADVADAFLASDKVTGVFAITEAD